jgi:hypothetical protein
MELRYARGEMRLVSLSIAAAAALDREFASHQTKSGEIDLVKELADAWPGAVKAKVRAAPGLDVLAGSTVIHLTPIVDIGTTPNPELGDLLLITAYLRANIPHRGRAAMFQAKTPRTKLPPHQDHLYRRWPVFRIVRPKIPAQWDVGPEGLAVPPSRRGTAFLRVQPGVSPIRYEVGRGSQEKSLGECVRAMLRCRYSRAFTRVHATSPGTNSWDQLITWLLQRTGDRTLRSVFGPEPSGFPTRPPRPGRAASTGSTSSVPHGQSSRPDDHARPLQVVYAFVRDADG